VKPHVDLPALPLGPLEDRGTRDGDDARLLPFDASDDLAGRDGLALDQARVRDDGEAAAAIAAEQQYGNSIVA
jgi:hypothetical protein